MKRWLLAAALSFVCCAAPSFAQSPPPSIGAAVLGGQTTLAVSTVTANVQLTAANPPYNAITVYNYGSNDVYFALGGSTVTATTGSTLLKAGNYLTVWVNGVSQTYLAAITGSSTSNLVIYQATGAVLIGSNSSGGSGGTVTANQGTGASLANAWSQKITDGTNGPAAVKPASTAPTSADPALVVAISPNSFAASATTNDSSTVTTGGTFQAVAASSTTRLSLDFVNLSGNGDACYIYLGTIGSATTSNSIKVADQQEYLRASGTIPSDAFNITCATTGDHFYAAVQ